MSKRNDCDTFFAPYIAPLLLRLSQKGEIVLVIDGSETGQECTTRMLCVICSIVRADRVKRMSLITLAQKAFSRVSDIAYYLFSILSKNMEFFFNPRG
ncbi:MAG TPA: hypothetical protein PKA00_21845 [Saprospiraceae bacterium]|nr:hypothetical protein [Saprospiraceae bacterium]HMQ85570.1 hypothetical protein [Saprospiraceae bacterium]